MAEASTVVLAVALLATYLTWTASRLDRLHARCELARAALDAQLVRRAAAALELATARGDARLRAAASRARLAGHDERPAAESALSEALRAAAPGPEAGDVHESAQGVVLARRFLNDAVRDTRRFRQRVLVRLLRLAGRAREPAFFDVDDEPPPRPAGAVRGSGRDAAPGARAPVARA